MRPLLMMLGALVFVAVAAAVVLLAVRVGQRRGPVRVSAVDLAAMKRYARKYLRKYPGASEKSLRDALRFRFYPAEPDRPDTRGAAGLGALAGGLGGMVGAAVGSEMAYEAKKVSYERRKEAVDKMVERVLDAVLGDD